MKVDGLNHEEEGKRRNLRRIATAAAAAALSLPIAPTAANGYYIGGSGDYQGAYPVECSFPGGRDISDAVTDMVLYEATLRHDKSPVYVGSVNDRASFLAETVQSPEALQCVAITAGDLVKYANDSIYPKFQRQAAQQILAVANRALAANNPALLSDILSRGSSGLDSLATTKAKPAPKPQILESSKNGFRKTDGVVKPGQKLKIHWSNKACAKLKKLSQSDDGSVRVNEMIIGKNNKTKTRRIKLGQVLRAGGLTLKITSKYKGKKIQFDVITSNFGKRSNTVKTRAIKVKS
ncbi:MAG: hypothetical protein LBM73_01170 [Candidatus Nomurabacteria bacterium]|jgi:hypothetical protein|nr:hypothetical protein [Candidatus Nomurabacteria bacterium]